MSGTEYDMDDSFFEDYGNDFNFSDLDNIEDSGGNGKKNKLGSFLRETLKSGKYGLVRLSSSLMPDATDVFNGVLDIGRTIKDDLSSESEKAIAKMKKFTSNFDLNESLSKSLSQTKSNWKSGKFISDPNAFDFDSFGDDDDYEEGSGEQIVEKTDLDYKTEFKPVGINFSNKNKLKGKKQAELSSGSLELQALGIESNQMGQKLMSQQTLINQSNFNISRKYLDNISKNLHTLLKVNVTHLKAFIELGRKTMPMDKATVKFLSELVKYQSAANGHLIKATNYDNNEMGSAASILGNGLDGFGYAERLKGNAKMMFENSLLGSMLSMGQMMSGMGNMSGKKGIGGMISMMDPLSMMFNSMLSGKTKTGFYNLNQKFKSIPQMLNSKLLGWQNEGGAKGLVGELLGLRDFSQGLNMAGRGASRDLTEMAGFDRKTQIAVTEIIPGYLSKIYSAISKTPETYYDYKTFKFKTIRSLESQQNAMLRSMMVSDIETSNTLGSISSKIMNNSNVKNNKNISKSEIQKGITDLIRGIAETGQGFQPSRTNEDYYFSSITRHISGNEAKKRTILGLFATEYSRLTPAEKGDIDGSVSQINFNVQDALKRFGDDSVASGQGHVVSSMRINDNSGFLDSNIRIYETKYKDIQKRLKDAKARGASQIEITSLQAQATQFLRAKASYQNQKLYAGNNGEIERVGGGSNGFSDFEDNINAGFNDPMMKLIEMLSSGIPVYNMGSMPKSLQNSYLENIKFINNKNVKYLKTKFEEQKALDDLADQSSEVSAMMGSQSKMLRENSGMLSGFGSMLGLDNLFGKSINSVSAALSNFFGYGNVEDYDYRSTDTKLVNGGIDISSNVGAYKAGKKGMKTRKKRDEYKDMDDIGEGGSKITTFGSNLKTGLKNSFKDLTSDVLEKEEGVSYLHVKTTTLSSAYGMVFTLIASDDPNAYKILNLLTKKSYGFTSDIEWAFGEKRKNQVSNIHKFKAIYISESLMKQEPLDPYVSLCIEKITEWNKAIENEDPNLVIKFVNKRFDLAKVLSISNNNLDFKSLEDKVSINFNDNTNKDINIPWGDNQVDGDDNSENIKNPQNFLEQIRDSVFSIENHLTGNKRKSKKESGPIGLDEKVKGISSGDTKGKDDKTIKTKGNGFLHVDLSSTNAEIDFSKINISDKKGMSSVISAELKLLHDIRSNTAMLSILPIVSNMMYLRLPEKIQEKIRTFKDVNMLNISEKVRNTMVGSFKRVSTLLRGVASSGHKAGEKIVDKLKEGGSYVTDRIGEFGKSLNEKGKVVKEKGKEFKKNASEWFDDKISMVKKWKNEKVDPELAKMADKFGGIVFVEKLNRQNLLKLVHQIKGYSYDDMAKLTISELRQIVIDYYNDNVKSVVSKISDKVKDGVKSGKDFISERYKELKSLGSNLFGTIKTTLSSGFEKLKGATSGIKEKLSTFKIGKPSMSNEPIDFNIENDDNALYNIGMKQLQLLSDIRSNTGFLSLLPNVLISTILSIPEGLVHLGAKALGFVGGIPKHVIAGLKKLSPLVKGAGDFLKNTAVGAGQMIGKGVRFGGEMLGKGLKFGGEMVGKGIHLGGQAIKAGVGIGSKALGLVGRGIGSAANYGANVIKNKGIWHNFDIDPQLFKMAKEAGGPDFIKSLKKKDLDSILKITHKMRSKELKEYSVEEKKDILLEYYNKYIKNKGAIKRLIKSGASFIGENVGNAGKFIFNVVKNKGIWHNFDIDPQLFKMAKEAGGAIFIEKLKKEQLVDIISMTHKIDVKEAKTYKVIELKEMLRDYYNSYIKNKGKILRNIKTAAGVVLGLGKKAFGGIKNILSKGGGLMGKAWRGGKKILSKVVAKGGEMVGDIFEILSNLTGYGYAKDSLDQLIAIRMILEKQFGVVDMKKVSKGPTSISRDKSGTTNGIDMGEHGFREGSREDKIEDAKAERSREIQEETLALLSIIAENTAETNSAMKKNGRFKNNESSSAGGGLLASAGGLGVMAGIKKAGSKIAGGFKKVGSKIAGSKAGSAVKTGATKSGNFIKSSLASSGSALKKGATTVGKKSGSVLKFIPELLSKILNSGPIKSALAKCGAKNGAGGIIKLISSMFKKFATHPKMISLIARIAASLGATATVIAAPAAIALKVIEAGIGFSNGLMNARELWGVSGNTELSFGMKVAAAVVGTLDGVLYGALTIISTLAGKNLGMFIEPIYSLLGGDTTALDSERSWADTRAKTIYGIDDVAEFTSYDTSVFKGNRYKKLKFKDKKGFDYWKEKRYEPLRRIENETIEDYGGEKVCISINSEDPERQKQFREAFTKNALNYLKLNKLEWVRSGIGEDDIDKHDKPDRPKGDKTKEEEAKKIPMDKNNNAVLSAAGVDQPSEKMVSFKTKLAAGAAVAGTAASVDKNSKDLNNKLKNGLTNTDKDASLDEGGNKIIKSLLTVIKTGFEKIMKVTAIVKKVGKKTIESFVKKVTSTISKLKADKSFQDFSKNILTKLGISVIGGPIGTLAALGWLIIEATIDFGKALANPKKVIDVPKPTAGQRLVAGLIAAVDTLFCGLLTMMGNKLGGNGLTYWYLLLEGKVKSFGASSSGDDIGQWGLIRSVRIYGLENEEMLTKFENSFFKFGMKKVLKFKDSDAYEYWKENRYEPLRKIERNIINKYGGEKVCFNEKTCDPDMANKYRNEFLKSAIDYIKKHKIEWLRSGISKKDLERAKTNEIESDAEGNIPEGGTGGDNTPKAPNPNGSGASDYGSEVGGSTGTPQKSDSDNPIQGLQVKQYAPVMKGFVSSLKNMFKGDKSKGTPDPSQKTNQQKVDPNTKSPDSGEKMNTRSEPKKHTGSNDVGGFEKIIGGSKLHKYSGKGAQPNGKIDDLHLKLDKNIIEEIDYLSKIMNNTGNTTTAVLSMGSEMIALLSRIAVALERSPIDPDNMIAKEVAKI